MIRTDQKSLRSLMDQSLHTPEQQAWLHKFIGFDFTIEYKPGKDNLTADALSRMFMLTWSTPHATLLDEVKAALTDDQKLFAIVQQCEQESYSDGEYTTRSGLLFHRNRLVIPADSTLIQKLLFEVHSSPIGGHAGVTRTLARLWSQFYWYDMRRDVQQFIAHCVTCQRAKSLNTLPAGLLVTCTAVLLVSCYLFKITTTKLGKYSAS